jgi:Polysulphide reductase, NrfD
MTEVRSYYGRPIVKEPVWKPEIPWYLFCGGLAGASAGLGLGARLSGNATLARNATLTALAGASVSPLLLIKDLGRPARFYNMLRVFKVTSPMSVGTWVLSGFGSAAGVAGTCELLGILPRLQAAAEVVAGVLGMPLATYTGGLLADTAIPVWHEARHDLPLVFASGAAASAGAAAVILTPPELAGPARRLALAGAVAELGATKRMEKNLGELIAEPYHRGSAGTYGRAAKALTSAGVAVLGLAGRRRTGSAVGGALILAGAACARWSVFKAGFASARDPKYTLIPQRRRLEERARQNGAPA